VFTAFSDAEANPLRPEMLQPRRDKTDEMHEAPCDGAPEPLFSAHLIFMACVFVQ